VNNHSRDWELGKVAGDLGYIEETVFKSFKNIGLRDLFAQRDYTIQILEKIGIDIEQIELGGVDADERTKFDELLRLFSINEARLKALDKLIEEG